MDKPNGQAETLEQETPISAEQKKITELEAALTQATAQTKQAQERAQYLTADLENIRRRAERDCQLRVDAVQAQLIMQLIALVDDFERAFENLQTKPELLPFITGFELTYKSFLKMLNAHQVKVIETVPGTLFNPELHEAVTQSNAPDFESGHIVAILQKGYTFKDVVLRPVKVTVKA